MTSPASPSIRGPKTNPPAGPAQGASPRTSFLCKKDTFRRTAIRVFSSPSLVPLLAAFMNWVIWAKAEGLIREAEGGPGTPATKGHHPHPGLQAGATDTKPPSPIPSHGGGSRDQEGQRGGATLRPPGTSEKGHLCPELSPGGPSSWARGVLTWCFPFETNYTALPPPKIRRRCPAGERLEAWSPSLGSNPSSATPWQHDPGRALTSGSLSFSLRLVSVCEDRTAGAWEGVQNTFPAAPTSVVT